MTDKEIIIDGVNFAGCMHYDKPYCDQSYLGEGGLLKNTPNPKKCEGRKNCYYKQLQRKTQECEEIAKWQPIISRLLNKFGSYDAAKGLDYEQYPINLHKELDNKTQENTELKDKLKSETNLKNSFLEQLGHYSMKSGEYKQILKEIYEIATRSAPPIDYSSPITMTEVMYQHNAINFDYYKRCNLIRQKINEVLKDE